MKTLLALTSPRNICEPTDNPTAANFYNKQSVTLAVTWLQYVPRPTVVIFVKI